ncbi:phytoene/squalene synthase family protein [Salinarimonas soli]|uniref:Phytoene/squalene synthase family protein n=1 Tax=Salinarimonas soli TaxID=1638099 RepID=A0A5B2V966_9HYPH|nr:phytoene/squalene synthase family protein [Salinarimonas soli]KAA2235376.1 phytoene/squalene synthase family protein [Salinarimonas soli]
MSPEETAAFAHCEALVREHDRDRYFAALFAPADKRPYLFALYAFSHEVARVRESVSAPLPGEIRLQWWRDALDGQGHGEVAANPVAAALLATVVRFRLPREALTALVDARVFDLYDDPMPDVNDLEGYCGETSSVLIRLASLVLADGEDPGFAAAAGHAGVAYALAGLLRAFAWHAARGQVFVPSDVLARHGVSREIVTAGQGGPGVNAALAELRTLARRHHREAFETPIPATIAPAFLPAVLVPAYLDLMDRRDYDPFRTAVELAPWRRQWLLWRGAKRITR